MEVLLEIAKFILAVGVVSSVVIFYIRHKIARSEEYKE